MAIMIQIPSALRAECGGVSELPTSAATVRKALDQLEETHPALYRSVCDDTGAVRRHVNVFVNDVCLDRRGGLGQKLEPGDVLTIMPAVSGG
ncbi:MAG: MoaD/ThiS family protein [Planctomycetota bacterium]|nr:MAG: MoaD/ThiS family protein [Planctomycetota bacterium]